MGLGKWGVFASLSILVGFSEVSIGDSRSANEDSDNCGQKGLQDAQ